MPSKRIRKYLPYAPRDLFAMVLDVERYPEFINLISDVRIVTAPKDGAAAVQEFTADVAVSFKFLSEVFRSTVRSDSENHMIEIKNAKRGGAVKQLSNNWKFKPAKNGGTDLEFSVDVTLKSLMLNALAGQKFDKAAHLIMGGFEARAAQICTRVNSGTIS